MTGCKLNSQVDRSDDNWAEQVGGAMKPFRVARSAVVVNQTGDHCAQRTAIVTMH